MRKSSISTSSHLSYHLAAKKSLMDFCLATAACLMLCSWIMFCSFVTASTIDTSFASSANDTSSHMSQGHFRGDCSGRSCLLMPPSSPLLSSSSIWSPLGLAIKSASQHWQCRWRWEVLFGGRKSILMFISWMSGWAPQWRREVSAGKASWCLSAGCQGGRRSCPRTAWYVGPVEASCCSASPTTPWTRKRSSRPSCWPCRLPGSNGASTTFRWRAASVCHLLWSRPTA